MVGFCKNAPKDEEWLREKIARYLWHRDGYEFHNGSWDKVDTEDYVKAIRKRMLRDADQIIAKMEEGGWVSPAYLKDALSRELAAGYRLAVDFTKEVNDEL